MLNSQPISEGSCDTEDWNNDTENSALPSNCTNISQCLRIFDQINSAFLNIRDLLQKHEIHF